MCFQYVVSNDYQFTCRGICIGIVWSTAPAIVCPLLFHKSQLKRLLEWSTHSLLSQNNLNNLKKRLLSFGKYLSMFPGSFSLTDACAVMSFFVREECLVEKLNESGLLQVTEGNHYHFRDTVKKHFRKLREESGIDESIFWREYLKHFSAVLERWSMEFQRNAPNYMNWRSKKFVSF